MARIPAAAAILAVCGQVAAVVACAAALPSPSAISTTVSQVLTNFMSNNPPGDCHWERATYFFGHTEAITLLNTGTTAALDYALAWADTNSWECGDSEQQNDFGPGWGYSVLYNLSPADYKLSLGATMSRALAAGCPSAGTTTGLCPYSWWWVDTLSMNVPQWLQYGAILGRPDFLATAWAQYNDTKQGVPSLDKPALWSTQHGLWWRDATYVNTSSPNGQPVFWGRGNGWAAITLMKTLSLPPSTLPSEHPLRADMQGTLLAMAQAVAPLQGQDGFWRSNLLDPSQYPGPETSGTAGITAGLAYGIRTGILPATTYLPIVTAAWQGLSTLALQADGTVGYCQPVGASPGPAPLNSTSDFCTGLFLLAARSVYDLAAALADPSQPPFDLRPFEDTILPAWLAQFKLPDNIGSYAFDAGSNTSTVYGSVGVVHALSVLQQLNLTAQEIQEWGAHIDTFENASTGFYRLTAAEENTTGYQPWHSAGWSMAALRILGRRALYPPAFAQEVALGNETLWNATFWPLFTSASIGIWSLSHKIAAIPTTLMMNDPHWATTYAPFFTWFWDFLAQYSSPAFGYWCLPANPAPPSCMCLGGAFHISFTLGCGGVPLPNPAAFLNTTLALQNPTTGLWNGDRLPGYIDQDGVWVSIRASLQLGQARWQEVEAMCTAYVRTTAAVLNNATLMLGKHSALGGIVHNLPGLVTPVAECARWFPALTVTRRPWIDTILIGCFG